MIKPLLGLVGVLLGALASEFNDQVTTVALRDVLGGFGIGHDAGTWVDSVYTSAEVIGTAVSPWCLVTFTIRRWTICVLLLGGVSSALIPLSPNIEAILTLRALQGLSQGMTVPILLAAGLKGLPPPIRLYGLAAYALTATFTPGAATALAALWTDDVNWRFVFFQAAPLCSVGALLVWYGFPQDEPRYERFRVLDWRGFLLLVVGSASLSTMLYQGNRLDWFNSNLIRVLAITSGVCFPLLLANEWVHPLPLLKLQLLGRRNFAYGVVGLFTFLIIAQSGVVLPLRFLEETQGYRPSQAQLVTFEIAGSQLVMLPILAIVLNKRSVDARVVSFIGLCLILTACVGSSFLTVSWNGGQFYLWQAFQAVGQPMVVMPLLMLATNAITDPHDGPFASAMVNYPRALAEVAGTWVIDLIERWRGALHSVRIVDQVGQDRWRLIQGAGVLRQFPPPLLANGQPRVPGALEAFGQSVEQQVNILTASDAYLVLGALTVFLMVVLIALPVRTLPPGILFGDHFGE